MDAVDPDEKVRQLAAESLETEDPTGWFERLYLAARDDTATVPWDRGDQPHFLLAEWGAARAGDGHGRRALVVGCGLGADAEYLASFGFDTVAFDIAPTAVQAARDRFPRSTVDFVVADLLDPPADWLDGFDLVFESLTVQALPIPLHAEAIGCVTRLVAPAGRLLVLSAARGEGAGVSAGPPWPLTRAEVHSFAQGGLEPVLIEELPDAEDPEVRRWRAEFSRPATGTP